MIAHRLGTMDVLFTDKNGRPGLVLVPQGMADQVVEEKAASVFGMAQLHVRGDGHETPYSKGMTMIGSHTSASMRLASRKAGADSVTTVLTDAQA